MISAELAVRHGAEFRRCLLEMDVAGIMALHGACAPRLPGQPEMSPAEATVALHMARADVGNFPKKVRKYSTDWLKDHGFEKRNGQWARSDAHKMKIFSESVGIASGGPDREFSKLVVRVQSDAVLECLAKGVVEPEKHKELMVRARAKLRFRKRLD